MVAVAARLKAHGGAGLDGLVLSIACAKLLDFSR